MFRAFAEIQCKPFQYTLLGQSISNQTSRFLSLWKIQQYTVQKWREYTVEGCTVSKLFIGQMPSYLKWHCTDCFADCRNMRKTDGLDSKDTRYNPRKERLPWNIIQDSFPCFPCYAECRSTHGLVWYWSDCFADIYVWPRDWKPNFLHTTYTPYPTLQPSTYHHHLQHNKYTDFSVFSLEKITFCNFKHLWFIIIDFHPNSY